ncbi:MAG: hypothetical protein HRT73_03390 [Flavobacteriales bacterium]|nr:hypothetical protein [Flavobacteriales bacterium]
MIIPSKLVLIISLFVFILKANAQTHKVYESDSISIEEYKSSYSRINGLYGIDFKETLADGHWQYFSKRNSKVGDFDKYYLQMEGNYKDSLKHGKFIYYSYPYTKKNKYIKRKIYKQMNYFNGLLDGYFCIYGAADFKIQDGTFNKGKKNGFFIDYVRGKVEYVSLYKDDTLREESIYHTYNTNTIQSHLSIDIEKNEEVLVLYDSIGNVREKAFFSYEDINKHQIYFPDGYIEKESEGKFYPLVQYKNTYNGTYRDRLYQRKLKNGIIRKYLNGILKEEEHYFNGKLQKKIQIEN